MSEDEKLNAFVDHELDSEQRAEMEALVAGDDHVKARVSRMRTNDDLVRSAFDAPMAAAVPDRFLSTIDSGLAKHANATVVSLKTHLTRASNDNGKPWWQIGGALAASLAVGLFFGTQLAPTADDATVSVALNDALNSTPSAQSVVLKSGERMTPQLTFARAGGGYCRQFSIAAGNSTRTGVACNRAGQWSVEALLPSGGAASAEDGYVTAGGRENADLDDLIGKLRAGDPLDKQAEKALIARRWK
jgi:hypothetical protein